MRTVLVCVIASFLVGCAGSGPEKPTPVVAFTGPRPAPVKHIGVYVLPYYQAAQTPEGRPNVAVAKKFDALLASSRQEDIIAVRDMIQAAPQLITPMTLMVLAIRLYDVGLRDDAVLWFYAAKDRYITLSDVLNVKSSGLTQVEASVRNFAGLAGPFINGYAFCDLAKQRELRMKALNWVEQNPYQVLFVEQLPAQPGDRAANLKRSLGDLRASAEKERQYFEDPKNVENFNKARKENQVDVKFCWR